MAWFQGSRGSIRDATRLICRPHAHRLVPCRCVVTPTSNLEFDGVRVLAGAYCERKKEVCIPEDDLDIVGQTFGLRIDLIFLRDSETESSFQVEVMYAYLHACV